MNLSGNGDGPSIAVLIPCYNEELTIRGVVCSFRDQLPHAKIYVFDDNFTDRTVAEAKAADPPGDTHFIRAESTVRK